MPNQKSTSRAWACRVFSTVLLCGFPFYDVGASYRPSRTDVQRIAALNQKLEIEETDSILLEFPDWLTTVKSFDPAVIRVTAIRPNGLRIHGVAPGRAVLHALDRGQRQYSVELNVRASTDSEE